MGDEERLQSLQARIDHLESLVEGLQDSVDRESRRHDEQIEDLRKRMEPSELARVLTADARRRGL